MTVLGISANNPFDISLPYTGYYGGSVIGAPGQPGFAQFPDLATGYAAGVQRLTDYVSGNTSYGTLNTIQSLGSVYATDPSYANSISQISGIPVNQTLDPNNPEQMQTLANAILTQELGRGPAGQVISQVGSSTTAVNAGTASSGLGAYEDIPSEGSSGGTTDLSGFSTGVNGATGGNNWVATTNPDGSVSYTDQGQTLDWSNLPDNVFDNSTVAPAVASGAAATAATPATAAVGAGGIAVNLTDETGLPSSVSGAGTAAKAGLTTAGSDVQMAAGGLAGTSASIINSAEAYTSRAFVMIALVVMGVIFAAFGLSIFGKRTLAAITP
jgi:hypothetical protein